MQPKEKPTTPAGTDDLRSLVRATLDDIGAIFEILTERQQLDPTTRSLCTTGNYLCDTWGRLILAEIDRNEPTSRTPHPQHPPMISTQKSRTMRRLNRSRQG